MEDNNIIKKNKISKILIRVVIFILLFSFLLVYISYFFRPYSSNRPNLTGYYSEEKNTLDMVYIGGSACYVFWAPMIAWKEYGVASFNFAYDTMPADAIKYNIIEVLKTQTPKLIVIDIRPFQYRDKFGVTEVQIRNGSDNMKYSFNRLSFLFNVVPKELSKDDLVSYVFDIVKYHSRWKELDNYATTYYKNECKNPYKGFYFVSGVSPLNTPNNSNITEQTPVSNKTDAILTDLLEFCKSKNLNVLFVTNSYYETVDDKKIYNYLGSRVNDYGFRYINTNDYNTEIGIDYSTDLYNNDHVNIFGAEKFTKFLGKYIKDNYKLPDHRNDKSYNSWNDDYMVWEQSANSTKEAITALINK